MTVTGVSQATDPSAASSMAAQTASTGDKNLLNYQSFLKLLLEQMKNQDPTSPIDSTQQLAQLASFSQVEQQVQSNQKLDSLLATLSLTQAGGLIGHTLTSADGATSGIVAGLKVVDGQTVALLQSGEEVPLVTGSVVTGSSEPAA